MREREMAKEWCNGRHAGAGQLGADKDAQGGGKPLHHAASQGERGGAAG